VGKPFEKRNSEDPKAYEGISLRWVVQKYIVKMRVGDSGSCPAG
jgi:hypothetical protein